MKTVSVLICFPAIIAVSMMLSSCQTNGESGRMVFQQWATCHNSDSNEKKMGPGLKGLFKRDTLASNSEKITDDTIRAKIDRGGNGMPAYENVLTDKDKKDLIEYLRT